jgi:hypothetical protein
VAVRLVTPGAEPVTLATQVADGEAEIRMPSLTLPPGPYQLLLEADAGGDRHTTVPLLASWQDPPPPSPALAPAPAPPPAPAAGPVPHARVAAGIRRLRGPVIGWAAAAGVLMVASGVAGAAVFRSRYRTA